MKLADKYVAKNKAVPSNGLYLHYQTHIDKALRSPGDLDPARVRVSTGAFGYEMTEDEEEFHTKLYVPTGAYQTGGGDEWLLSLFGEGFAERLRIGENDKDLLDFVRGETRILALIAPVGIGKTVLLKHVWLHLLNHSQKLQETVLPIYVSVDQFANDFDGITSARKIRDEAYRLIIRPELMHILLPFTDVDNEDFWQFTSHGNVEFSDLSHREKALSTIKRGSAQKVRQEIQTERMKAKDHRVFPFCGAKYLVDKLTKVPILIFDNVDPMSIDVHTAMLQEAVYLSERYKIKIIISMRDVTARLLERDRFGVFATYPMIRVHMVHRDIAEYFKARIGSVMREARKEKFTYIDYKGKKLTQADAERVLLSMVELLLRPECAEFLENIAQQNLRQINLLMKFYLATGYLDLHKLAWDVFRLTATEDAEYKSPLWVLISSVLTANYETHFSAECPEPQVLKRIVNLYCNHGLGINEFTIRFHVLHYFERNGEQTYTRLKRDYSVLWGKKVPESFDAAIDRSIRRLLECGLLSSPEFYMIDDHVVLDEIKHLAVTDTGKYYRRTISVFFEYLAFMKDDVILTADHTIVDCVRERTREGRYKEIGKFLTLMFESEKAFFSGLDLKQRHFFRENFNRPDDPNPYVVCSPVQSMITFGKDRQLPPQDVGVFQSLEVAILQLSKGFLPANGSRKRIERSGQNNHEAKKQ